METAQKVKREGCFHEKFKVNDVETFIAAIEDEIQRASEGRYYHRLHVVLHALKTAATVMNLSVFIIIF